MTQIRFFKFGEEGFTLSKYCVLLNIGDKQVRHYAKTLPEARAIIYREAREHKDIWLAVISQTLETAAFAGEDLEEPSCEGCHPEEPSNCSKCSPGKEEEFKCQNLDSTPPKSYPTGYEGCKKTGKICLFKAEGRPAKDCPMSNLT